MALRTLTGEKLEAERARLAALREYEKKSLKEGERILDQEVTYTETPGLVKADVLLEVERDIGVEQKIDMKKEDAEREKK